MPLYANAGSWSKHAACCARSADSLPLAPCRGGTAENETDIEHQPRIANRRATWEPMVPGQLVPAYGWRVLRVSKEFQTTASGALPANPLTRGNHNSNAAPPHEASGRIVGARWASAANVRRIRQCDSRVSRVNRCKKARHRCGA